jgi:hypothetical protein
MEARKSLISDIFNGFRVLEIPFFQRSYVWEEPQWERFINDMEEVSHEKRPYFLGSVILKQQPANLGKSPGDHRTVIDGQQRLTTLCIFFKVLSLKTGVEAYNQIYRILMTHDIALLHNRLDTESFNKVLNNADDIALTGTDNITKAYNYFRNNVDCNIIDPQCLLANLMFVSIDLGTDDDEQEIFDTINSLGVKLTTGELLKNYFFSRQDVDSYTKNWYEIFEDESNREYWGTEINAGRITRSLVDLFFYAYLQIKIQEPGLSVKTDDKIHYAKVESLFNSYKDFISKYGLDKDTLINEIKEYAELFHRHFRPQDVASSSPSNAGMERMNVVIFGLQMTTLIPYILYLLRNAKQPDDITNVLQYLESYIMRRMICHETTKNYNHLFGDLFINNQLLTVDAVKASINAKGNNINFMPDDTIVKNGFDNSRLTNKQTTGILYLLETKLRFQGKHATAMLGFEKYSLEHIMPKKWQQHWTGSNNDFEKAERDRKVLTLGNLTIIPSVLNSSISNGSWKMKRDGDGTHDGYKVYANDLMTFSSYLSKDDWNESIIAERADDLAIKANGMWKI